MYIENFICEIFFYILEYRRFFLNQKKKEKEIIIAKMLSQYVFDYDCEFLIFFIF